MMVGLYEGSRSIEKAESDGLKVGLVEEAAEESDVIMMLIPDHIQSEVYRESVLPHLLPGKTLMFAHGFNIHFEAIVPPDSVDVSDGRAQGSRPPDARGVHAGLRGSQDC